MKKTYPERNISAPCTFNTHITVNTMSDLHIGALRGAAQELGEVFSDQSFILAKVSKSKGPLYPKLASHEGIMIRSMAVADNMDEVLMLPQGHIFPLNYRLRRDLRWRRITKTKESDNTQTGGRRPLCGWDYPPLA